MKEIESIDVVCQITYEGMWIGAKTKLDSIRNSANALAAEIEKHCDYYENHDLKYNFVCSFCGDIWENVINDKGCPECCNKAIVEWEEEQAKTKAEEV